MALPDVVITERDFEQLPPALQRKYFSSLERLRLAHDANTSGSLLYPGLRHPSIKRPFSSHHRSFPRDSTSSETSTQRSHSVVSLRSNSSRARLRKGQSHQFPPSISLINPWEFAALPLAVQRKQFSVEEQYYIASRVNPVILDAADEALYRSYQNTQYRSSVGSATSDLTSLSDTQEPTQAGQEEALGDMDAKDLESFRWLDNDQELDLKLDDYHTFNAEISNGNRQPTTSNRRRSFRRGLSFSNVSFGRRSSSSLSLQSPPVLGLPASKSVPPALSLAQPDHKRTESSTSADPASTHYQDPTAKMKLRVYLASPQKFDEALEFGFPALHREAVQSQLRPKTSPGIVNGQPKTFFADDTPSLSDDGSRDERSDYVTQDSPRTPIDMSFPSRPSYKSSTDRSSGLRPRIVANLADNYAHASASDREMTLRMTLTRPELRALEHPDLGKTQLINKVPIEKAPLTIPVSNSQSIWDELPEEPSRVKRFFKKLKGIA